LDTSDSGGAFDASSGASEKGEVTVDDASFMVAQFVNGALGSFESSRFAAGRQNYNSFEIYGDKGSIAFNLERMNELDYCSLEDAGRTQGFRTIQATHPTHPYIERWWPPGHIIGYEHTFVHAVADFLDAVTRGSAIHPSFDDALKVMQVLAAGLEAAATGRTVQVAGAGAARA
jgi:predicted dehydrogenase